MFTIQANQSGTRTIEISEEHLKTIEKYALFQHLIDSNGIVNEPVLDKLKLNIRSLIASMESNSKDLLDLCIDVIYNNNMKAFGLYQLIQLYLKWEREKEGSLHPDILNEPLN
ncbi:MAG TPA: hypothetical protein H9818_10020 [Candidatus Phocaeicola gallistercoris]|jgi:hypothetical protein|nr:hypothetical protein [Candidatus Phocaeicola gallistercoris]